mmetsp:Transcript_6155/g.15618  ORF Transcript_6155/g.15618 Transcript_6155/m.15618 type:complete len:87 (-) Transcript_6155:892-1152(-)
MRVCVRGCGTVCACMSANVLVCAWVCISCYVCVRKKEKKREERNKNSQLNNKNRARFVGVGGYQSSHDAGFLAQAVEEGPAVLQQP